MRAMKAIALSGALALACAGAGAGAQQISRIAVIDLPRVVMAIAKDPTAYRDFENRRSQVQTEIDRMSLEIKRLQALQADAEAANDAQAALRLKGEAEKKSVAKASYVKAKQAELDELARRLAAATPEISSIYRQIQQYAEGEGYSLVLNLKAADYVIGSVIWYSSMIDITDLIIQKLAPKAATKSP